MVFIIIVTFVIITISLLWYLQTPGFAYAKPQPKPKPKLQAKPQPTGGKGVYLPGVTTYQNNSYSTGGKRFADSKVQNAKGYIVTDPGNLIGRFRDCGGSRCLGALKTDQDAAKIKPIVSSVQKNGGQPIAYMSLTIEPGREDIKGLKKGVDYTRNKMTGWSEFGPKLTQNYIDVMKKRVDLIAKSGFKAMEFDNIDIIADSKVRSKMGVTDGQWKRFVTDMVKYANSKGVSVMQKNTVPEWGKDMNNLFAGAIVETTGGSNKGTYDWSQIGNLLQQGKPVLINHKGGGCSGMQSKIQTWTGTGSGAAPYIISGC